jgi:hypothetical protein
MKIDKKTNKNKKDKKKKSHALISQAHVPDLNQ